MIGFLILAGYIFMWLVAAVVIHRAMNDEFDSSDAIETAMGAVLACITGMFWPLALPAWLVHTLSKMETPAERHRRRQVEKDQRVQELQFKIRRLERELGIGQERAS